MTAHKKWEPQNFDYSKTKEEFRRLQYSYIKRKSKGIIEGKVHLWTREKVNLYIDIILEYKKKNECYQADEEMAKYDVFKIDNVWKLVFKRKRYRGQRIEIVPFEDCFDKILLIHRRFGHNVSLSFLYKELTKKYVIDKVWIFLIQRSCNFCKSMLESSSFGHCDKILNTPLGKFSRCYQVIVTPVPFGKTESPYTMLMAVIDRITTFVILRPLIRFDENHVTIELVKVFTDYGWPKLIETRESPVFEEVVDLLPKFNTGYKLNLLTLQHENNPKTVNIVLAYLKEWVEINETDEWVSGCPIVQWQMNTMRRGDDSTPYKEVFSMDPVKDLIVG